MPTPVNDSDNQSQLQQNNNGTPPNQNWNESPPAYETLTNLPSWCVSPTDYQLIPPAYNSQWCRPPQVTAGHAFLNDPAWCAPPEEYLVNITPAAQEHHNTRPATHSSNVSSSFPMQNPCTINTTEDSTDIFEHKYCRPKTLGSSLIIVAIAQFGSGITLSAIQYEDWGRSLSSAILFWAPVFYFITGCVTIASSFTPTFSKAKLLMFLSLASLALSCVGLALVVLDLLDIKCTSIGSSVFDYPLDNAKCEAIISTVRTIFFIIIVSNVLLAILFIMVTGVAGFILHYTSAANFPVLVNRTMQTNPAESLFVLPQYSH